MALRRIGKYLAAGIGLLAVGALAAPEFQPEALVLQGHFKRAKVVTAAYIQEKPNDARGHVFMSRISVAYSQYDEAIQHAEKAVSLQSSSESHAQLAEALGAKLGSNGVGFLEKTSLAERFRKEAEMALQLDSSNFKANSDLLQFYVSAPAMLGGSKDRAKQLVDQLLRVNAVRGNLLAARNAALQESKPEEIELFLKRAADAGPNDYEAQISLADFYLSAKNTDAAEAYASKAIKIDPQRLRAYTVLGVCYTQRGKWNELDSVLSQSERNIPDDFTSFFQSGRIIVVLDIKDQLSRAEKYFRKYLSQEPEPRQPAWSRAHWRLGQVLGKQGRKDEAKKELQLALQLEPGLKEAAEDLKRLE